MDNFFQNAAKKVSQLTAKLNQYTEIGTGQAQPGMSFDGINGSGMPKANQFLSDPSGYIRNVNSNLSETQRYAIYGVLAILGVIILKFLSPTLFWIGVAAIVAYYLIVLYRKESRKNSLMYSSV